MNDPQPVQLDLLDRATVRQRTRTIALSALVIAAALGGIVGLFGGPIGFFVTVLVVAAPLPVLAYGASRKTSSLQGSQLRVSTLGTRVVSLDSATKLDVLVTDARGSRTVSLLVTGPPKGKTVSLPLAIYAGTGGRELGVYALRRLADALASSGDTRALVLSELIVAQLRAEARGEPAAGRPLFQLASLAAPGRMAQRLRPEEISRFVTALG